MVGTIKGRALDVVADLKKSMSMGGAKGKGDGVIYSDRILWQIVVIVELKKYSNRILI